MKTTLLSRLVSPDTLYWVRATATVVLYIFSLMLVPTVALLLLFGGYSFGGGLALIAGAALLGFAMTLAGTAVDPEND